MAYFASHSTHKLHWDYKTDGFEYKKAKDLQEGKIYSIHGFYVTPDNGYGEGLTIILDDCFLNAPTSNIEDWKGYRQSEEAIKLIKEGKAGIVVTSYISQRFKRKCYNMEIVDIV